MKQELRRETGKSGRQRLMDAALRLSGRTRSLHALGIRELAREAGLNPNTFYRHFRDLDELGLAVLEDIFTALREPLRQLRREAAESVLTEYPSLPANPAPAVQLEILEAVVGRSVERYFEFATRHPDAFIVGARELSGPSPVLRDAIRGAMGTLARDLAADFRDVPLPQMLDDATLGELSWFVIRQTFDESLDYLEHPEQRPLICRRLSSQIVMMVVGGAVLRGDRQGGQLSSLASS